MNKIKWFAHRGLRHNKWHDNSLFSIRNALKSNASGVEIDIQYDASIKKIVIGHDNLDLYNNIYNTEFSKVLDLTRQFPDKIILLDIKGPNPGLLASTLATIIKPKDNIIISSFNECHLECINYKLPNIPIGLITSNFWKTINLENISLYTFLSIDHQVLDAQSIKNYNNLGIDIYTWNVNNEQVAKKLINWGVNGIITDSTVLLHSCTTKSI
jgi:glycerophosphoryl diester phosphodiesterase